MNEFIDRVKSAFKDFILESAELGPNRAVIKVRPNKLKELSLFLRDGLGFDYFIGAGGTDFKRKGIIQMAYYLFSTRFKTFLMLKVDLPRDNPTIVSLVDIWEAAEYH